LTLSHARKSCQRRIQDKLIFAACIARRLVVANRNLSFSADTSCHPFEIPCLPTIVAGSQAGSQENRQKDANVLVQAAVGHVLGHAIK
jgi:hypothetical protein